MTRLGKQLVFISRINPDGSGTEILTCELAEGYMKNDRFDLSCLSITNGTYIAAGFNSFVVKLKNPPIISEPVNKIVSLFQQLTSDERAECFTYLSNEMK